jgi:predicted  nucleic acid-binding Zn-ribbon protein
VTAPSVSEDWKPRPDPTVLTTEALQREIGLVRASLEAGRDRLHELLTVRMESMTALTDEKFHRIDRQFDLVEAQRVEQKKDTKAAVDAALTAQKEAVREQTTASDTAIAKAERAITKQMEQLGATFAVTFEGIRRDIDTWRERIGLIEQRIVAIEQMKAGGREATTDRRASAAAIYAFAGFILTVLTIAGIVAAVKLS